MKTHSSCLSPLNGKTFVLELSRDIRFQAKQELINYLREQNAQISYILTASTDYVLVSNDIDTYKTRRAKQLGIPLVNVEYIYECRNISIEKEPVDIKRFLVTSAEDKENFSKSGTIPVSGGGSSSVSSIKPVKLDLSKIKIWNSDDVELPKFDELTHAEIGKWAIFKETNENSDVYFAFELQIIPEEYNNQINNDYRLRFRYEKQTITSSKGKISLIQYAFSNDINELHQLFASYYYRIATMPRITRIRDLLPDKLGSKLLLRSLFLHRIDTQMLDDNICQLIESLWIESIGDLNNILSVQPESIALKTIIEAEAALLEIKSESKSSSEAETRFYSLIPHRQQFVVDLVNNRRALIDKTDLCQMLRDMLTVNELTNWNVKASIEAKYRSLKCHIETVGNDTHEYRTICDMISSSTNPNEKVIIHQIYSIAKQTDVLNFRSTLFNQKQLFHGSKFNNFLGILSRGLLTPKMVVNDFGITRTDIGCLGYGIYFSDSVSTSLKYTTPSTTRPGRRLLCISQVALGESAKFYSYSPNLIQPPDNFHSTHGVKKTNENNSKFIDDEYAIYNLDQQRLLYIVEVSWIPYDDNKQSLKLLPIIRDQLTNRSIIPTNEVDIPSTIEDEVIQIAEQDYGLICPSSGQLVPLKAFHIRAQLVDVTAEVVLYQVYHNTSSIPIEAKYVFPLDENCSVCGFEAHINNKIIKGVVKEKEQAKREYREAIEKGHGAYLMHQEQPEVFSVSVGNLPANCEVIIKITYVAELPIENNDIIFRLPAKVASWQSKQALEMKDQTIVPSINLEQDNLSMKSIEFSLKTSIRMPYEIIKLFSPTHRLRRKITDCIAMIELVDNILLEKDFILSITLKTVNLPRMLNETYDLSDNNSQACMLTFYPKFEITNNSNEYVEIVFIIDVSNSMDGNHVQQAKQLAHLFLTNMKHSDGNIYFNIVTFGSDNDECFPISSPNTKENIDKAKHFILHSLDHRGNTDLFSVLRQYSLLPSPSKLGRQFILLSDGHINDLKSILTLLENQSSMRHDRLFTCSIGDTSNKHNLKQLSNQANGGGLTTVFDSNYRSRWKTKVLQILEHIHQPCVTNISIDWHGTIDNQQEKFTNQAPKIIRSLFNGMRLTVYRFIQNCHKATLTARINNQEFVTSVFSNKITETKGRILHCLTARSIIQDYENGLLDSDESENELIKKQYKQDLIELSIKYSVVSSFTSFVAIEERDGQELEPGVRLLDVMFENDIDLLPYIGWDGDRSQIDLIKEKLINAKRLFDSASISNKIELTNEYENLCKNISYRSGGDAKYELMLTIIDTYRTILKEKDKARQLKEKMKDDLINEINNAAADERKILEKRLDEINTRFEIEELKDLVDENIIYEEIGELFPDGADLEGDGGWGDLSYNNLDTYGSCIQNENALIRRSSTSTRSTFSDKTDDKKYSAPLPKRIDDRKEMKTIDTEESGEEMGFGLFGGEEDMVLQTAGLKLEARAAAPAKKESDRCLSESDESDESDEDEEMLFSTASLKPIVPAAAAPAKKVAEKWLPKSEEEDEGDDMGFGLFDDGPVSSSITSFTEEKKPFQEAKKSAEKASEHISDASRADQRKAELSLKRAKLESMRLEKLSRSSVRYSAIETQSPNVPQFQQHTQQQQMMDLPSYAPISPSYAPTSPSYTPTSPSYAPSLFKDFGSLPPSTTAPLIPPKLPPSGAFSFVTPGSSNTNNNIPTFSVSTGFRAASPFSFGAPPPPPPHDQHYGSLFSFAPRESSVDNNIIAASSMSTGFGGSTTFPSTVPPPPRLPPTDLFGSSSSSTNNPFGTPSAQPVFGAAPTFSSTVPTPPRLPSSSLFGNSGGSANNAFGTPSAQPVFGNQQMSTPSIFQHLPPQAASTTPFSFGSPSVLHQQQSFSFGTSSTSTTTNVAPPTTVGQSMFAVPAAVPPPPPPLPTTFGQAMFVVPATVPPPPPPPPPTGFGQTMFAVPATVPPPPPPPPATLSQSMFTVSAAMPPPPPPPIPPIWADNFSNERASFMPDLSSTLSSAAHYRSAASSSSMKSAFASGDAPNKSKTSRMSVEQRKSDDNNRDRVRSDKAGRGGRDGFFLATGETRQRQQVSELECSEQVTLLCDTQSGGQALEQLRSSTTSALSGALDLFSKKKSKKKSIQESKASIESEKSVLQDLLLLDVTPLSFGIEDTNGHMCTIISRNRTIPLKTQFYPVFTNAYAYQTTATIRVFRGEHKLTKYNTLIGEFTLTGLTPNFASRVLEISIRMEIDANGLLEVEAEESRSGAKAKITINEKNYPLNKDGIERHLEYVESNPNFRALHVTDRQSNDSLYTLNGESENTKINFTGDIEIFEGLSIFKTFKAIELTSTIIMELKRIQSKDGSFDLNQDLADLLGIDINNFDELKKYLYKQGFNSFALNIQDEIIRLIATGIILLELFFQIPKWERKTYLVPFDQEEIRSIFHRHLPRILLEHVDKAIHFYEQKRLRYGIYCERLELNYSSWEKFIQYSIFHIDN